MAKQTVTEARQELLNAAQAAIEVAKEKLQELLSSIPQCEGDSIRICRSGQLEG